MRARPWLLMVALVTLLSGLLFGYDQGVISGALSFIQADMDLGDTMAEVITSWVTLGALFGALLAGVLADRLGRRTTLVLAGVLFVAGALGQSLAPGAVILTGFRFVVGLGVGVASLAAPLYASEMAPAAHRGRMVSVYQLAITIGIFVAQAVDDLLSSSGDWRLMLGLAAVPGVALVVVMIPMTDTPRWLVSRDRSDDARRALQRVHGPDEDLSLDDELASIEAHSEEQAPWREVWSPAVRPALMVGIGLAVFQQITGINAVIYYSDQIFAAAGLSSPEAQAAASLFGVGGINILATLVAVVYVDRFGRKPLLEAGLVGMTAGLLLIAGGFAQGPPPPPPGAPPPDVGPPEAMVVLTLMGLVVFIASFAFSLGPVVWTMIAEIFPNRVRGRAMATATALNWAAAFLVSQTFLTLMDDLGEAQTFLVFAALSVAGFVWIRRYVPETKGRTLEEIEASWAERGQRQRRPERDTSP